MAINQRLLDSEQVRVFRESAKAEKPALPCHHAYQRPQTRRNARNARTPYQNTNKTLLLSKLITNIIALMPGASIQGALFREAGGS